MTTGGSKAAVVFLFASLTLLSASWHCREAGHCPGWHRRARCTANLRVVGKDLSHSVHLYVGDQGPQPQLLSTLIFAHGYARGPFMPSSWAPTSPSRRCSRATRQRKMTCSEAPDAVQSSKPTSSACSSLLAVPSHREGLPMPCQR